MNTKTAEQAAEGLRKIMDGKLILQAVLKTLDTEVRQIRPGAPLERIAIGLSRAVRHLGEAVADIPEELWQAMLASLGDLPLAELEQLDQTSKAA